MLGKALGAETTFPRYGVREIVDGKRDAGAVEQGAAEVTGHVDGFGLCGAFTRTVELIAEPGVVGVGRGGGRMW